VTFTAQVAAGVVVLAAALLGEGHPDPADLGWALAAGVANGCGTAFLYRGLSSGRMGVVAPVSGVGSALVPVVAGVGLGERPSLLVWVGILTALPGIWLVSREPAGGPGTDSAGGNGAAVAGRGETGSAVTDGVLAGLGFGLLFVFLARIDESAGLLPLALNQGVAALTVVALATALGGGWLPRQPRAALGAVSGVMLALATIGFLVASRGAYLSVTAVVVSLYPAFTVLLAVLVLREHVHRGQAAGLALCGVAVSLVALG